MSQLGPVTSLKFITHNNFFLSRREGGRDGRSERREGKRREKRAILGL